MIPTVTNPMGISLFGRRLQYLASTGTQYINTGIAPDFAGGDSIEIRFTNTESYTGPQPCVFGSRETGLVNGIYTAFYGITFCGTSTQSQVSYALSTTRDYTIHIDDNTIIRNGTVLAATPERVTCGLPIFLFALNNYGTGTYGIYSGLKLYDWKYWRNGTLAQHLVPVLDRSGVPCMYDTISRTLVYNAGTGSFDYE